MTMLGLAILEIAASEIALPSEAVREVVHAPAHLAPVPRAPDWSLGSFVLREMPIPVIDLACLLSLRTTAEANARAGRLIAVVAQRGALFGFAVDHVHDVISIAAADCHRTTRTDNALVPLMFVRAGGNPVYILDLNELFAIDDLMTVWCDAGVAASVRAVRHETERPQQAIVVQIADMRFAIAIAAVREIRTLDAITPPALAAPAYLGHVVWREQSLALLDPTALLGAPTPRAPSKARFMLVLSLACGEIAFAVDEVAGSVTDCPDTRVTLGEAERQGEHMAAVLADSGSGRGYWVDHESLGADERIVNYAALASRPIRSRGAQAAVAWQRFAYMHFDAGGRLSAAIEDIDAVAEYPPELLPGDRQGLFEGRFVHDGHSVMLVDLGRLLGRESRRGRRVLIVGCSQGRIGFSVDHVERIDYIDAPAASHVERPRGASTLISSTAQGCTSLVSLGEGSAQCFLAVVRLRRLADRLLDPAPARAQLA